MTDDAAASDDGLVLDFEYQERPEKVWRAVSEESLRRRWLPDQNVLEILHEQIMERLDLLLEEVDPPFQRSIVTFILRDNGRGGTVLGIVHRISVTPPAANSNVMMMLAA